MARAKPKADNRADTRGGGWVGIPHVVVDSPAYRSLSLWARAVLIEIVREFRGYNNGEIAITITQLCERLGNSNRGKASRAIAELMERGLIDVSAEARWKERLAREYRLTFVSSGARHNLRPATNDYRNWTPTEKIGGNTALPEKGLSGHASLPERESTGNASLPAKFEKLRKSAISEGSGEPVSGNDASPLISKPYTAPKQGGAKGHETPEIDPLKTGGDFPAVEGVKPEALAMAEKLGAGA